MASPTVDPAEAGLAGIEYKADATSDAGFDMSQEEEEIVRTGLDWRNQLTVRSLGFGIFTGFVITFISMSIGLSGAGVSPGYSPVSALLGYAVLKPYTTIMIKLVGENSVQPLTRQEICIIQGVATSLQSLRHALGVSTWFWALHNNAAAQLGPGETFKTYKELEAFLETKPEDFQFQGTVPVDIGTMGLVALLIAFTGILIVTVFRRIYVVDLKLPFPSPVATAVMINAFFSDSEAEVAAAQLKWFVRYFCVSFIWTGFDWMFTGTTTVDGKAVGCRAFNGIPVLGMSAYKRGWNLSIGSDYGLFVGVGLILTPTVSWSILLGGMLSYGYAYPAMEAFSAAFPEDYSDYGVNGTMNFTDIYKNDVIKFITEEHAELLPTPNVPESLLFENTTARDAWERSILTNEELPYWSNDRLSGLDGFYGYKVMFGVGIMLADGLFALCMMCYILFQQWRMSKQSVDPATKELELQGESDADRAWRINVRIFTEDKVDDRIIAGLYLFITVLGAVCLPLIYSDLIWYMIMCAFLMTPIFALVGNYIAGLTDWNLMSNFAKLAALVFSVWAAAVLPDTDDGRGAAVLVALFCCGIVYCGGSNSTDIIGDLYTGFLTQTSPKAMIIAQLVGFVFGCFVVPAVFWMFYATEPSLGWPESKYPNSYGVFYRAMAMIGTGGGFDALPRYCLDITYGLFVACFFLPLGKMLTVNALDKREMKTASDLVAFWWPSPAAAGIPFIAGVGWVLPTTLGFIARLIWVRVNEEKFEMLYQSVAAGILVGTGMWAIPGVIFAFADVSPPGCIRFV